MKFSELKLEEKSYYFSCEDAKAQYKWHFSHYVTFPVKSSQAKHLVKECHFGNWVMNSKDVERVEALMNKHGYSGDYRYTKSKDSVRLLNVDDFNTSLKIEFNF